MKKYIKIITGFRADQQYTIESEEAHKAYYLFRNPEKRGIFNNGVAIVGQNIQGIEPDYHATMGWNPTHKLDDQDWEEIRGRGVDRAIREIQQVAQEVAKLGDEKISLPLSEASKDLPALKTSNEVKQLADKFKV